MEVWVARMCIYAFTSQISFSWFASQTANKAKFSGYTVDIVLLTSVLSVLEAELPAWPSCSDVSTWSSPEGCPIIMQDAKNIRQVQEYYCHKQILFLLS